jgi:hypothetical protein
VAFWAMRGKEDDAFVYGIVVDLLGPWEFHISMCTIFRGLGHIGYYSYFMLLVLGKYEINIPPRASLVSSGLSGKLRSCCKGVVA